MTLLLKAGEVTDPAQGIHEERLWPDPRSDEVYRYTQRLYKDQKLEASFSREGDEVVVLT